MAVVGNTDPMPMDVQVHLVIGFFAISVAGSVVGVEGIAQKQRTARQDNRIGKGQFDVAREKRGDNVYIVDDICDGGRTFIALASEIRARNAGAVYLIVSHGIFSYGEEPLRRGGIDHVYTTDSFKAITSPYITQVQL